MLRSDLVKGACVAAALGCLMTPQAEAIEMFGGSAPVAHLNDGLIANVVVVRHGGVYRGPRGGVYRHGTVYRHGPYRPGYGYHGYGYRAGNWGGWARPGSYSWPVGGAVAAGAAIGFVTAATAAAWAGPAPGPGLCWYYTSPSRTQGFWDACQ